MFRFIYLLIGIKQKTKKKKRVYEGEQNNAGSGIIRRKRVAQLDSKRVVRSRHTKSGIFFWRLSKVEDARGPVVGGGEHARTLGRERKV